MALLLDYSIDVRNGRRVPYVRVTGTRSHSLAEIAQELCATSDAVLKDLLELPDNEAAVDALWYKYGRPLIEKLEKDTEQGQQFRAMFWLFGKDDSYDGRDGEIQHPSQYLDSRLVRRAHGLTLAKNLNGTEFQNWKVDFRSIPHLVLTPEMDQAEWKQCRISNSVSQTRPEKVAKYRKAVQALNPYLDRVEALIVEYEKAAAAWTEDPASGQQYLRGVAALNLFERMTDIYSRQDEKVKDVNVLAKELLEHCGDQLQTELTSSCLGPLKKMAALYADRAFNNALFEYLKLWNPTDHYYFHKIVANSVGAPTPRKGKSDQFDERLFQAVDTFAKYLSASPMAAANAGTEANRTFKKLYTNVVPLANNGKLDSRNSFDALLKTADKMLADLQKAPETGLLSTFAVWSGYALTWIGNIEGPPTVLGLILIWFSKSRHFVEMLDKDSMLEGFVMIGVDKRESDKIAALIRKGGERNIEVARQLFQNGSWRSNRIYVAFYVLGLAILIYHAADLARKVKTDEDPADSELFRMIMVLTQDICSLGLTTLTFKYSRDLDAFLAENARAGARQIAQRIAVLEAGGWRVLAVRFLHRGLTFVGVAISVWDLGANWGKADNFEKLVLAGTAGASLMMFLGALGCTSWMGPAGFVIGVILGIALVVYQKWFKTGFENTLRAMLDAFEGSRLYESMKFRIVGEKFVFIIFPAAKSVEDVLDELRSAVFDIGWAIPPQEQAVHYARAGLASDALAQIYESDKDKMKRLVDRQWYQLERDEKRAVTAHAEFLDPRPGTTIYVSVLSPQRVVLYNHDLQNYIWLDAQPQWYGGEPVRFLAEGIGGDPGNSFDPSRNAIILRQRRRTNNMQVFEGALKVQEMPPGSAIRFYLKVPSDDTKWVNGKPTTWSLQKLIEFPVSEIAQPQTGG